LISQRQFSAIAQQAAANPVQFKIAEVIAGDGRHGGNHVFPLLTDSLSRKAFRRPALA
jgi:hypothetical protein